MSALQRVGTAWRTTSRPSAVLREAVIRFSHCLLAIGALEAANGKVTPRHLLEMLDERVVSLLFRGTAATLAGMLARAPKAEKSDRRLSYAPADNCISRGVENSGKSVARRSLLPPNAIYII